MPIYQRMWSVMQNEDPSVFVSDNSEGVARVLRSRRGYAFFMESSMIDYVTHTKCNLTRIGSLLDSKSYGIGMPTSIVPSNSIHFEKALTYFSIPRFTIPIAHRRNRTEIERRRDN